MSVVLESAAIRQRDRFLHVRRFSETLMTPLDPEDCTIQSMPDASPVKWHLAHTTWFFETFVLSRFAPAYRVYHERFCYLFNSYYNAVGKRHPRPQRGLLSRPALREVMDYREYVDAALVAFLEAGIAPEAAAIVELGIHHEQQHQELLLTDVKHLFFTNPLWPSYRSASSCPKSTDVPSRYDWSASDGGILSVGFQGDGFHYDNEGPRHQVYLRPFQLGRRLVTNHEYRQFVDDGGYQRPQLWLSDGWDTVQREGWSAPLYWVQTDLDWEEFTLHGLTHLDASAPVTHVSYYEADAYARWSGTRLPTELEWESVASGESPEDGNFVESGYFHPHPLVADSNAGVFQLFGDVWEWTSSPYVAYPGYLPAEGALGEYNGKFMCNQMVLRGGSCATSRTHIRPTYRNFFYPDKRWQFSGIRLAR